MVIPVYIGYDRAEPVAFHVLASSLIRHASSPLSITAVGSSVLPRDIYRRPRGPHDSTEFSNARFAVPLLAGYQGWAVFMDCDMLAVGDLTELWQQRDPSKAVMVVRHNHVPEHRRKFLGQEQARYSRKNWSSLMLLNCAHPASRTLTAEYLADAPGLDLHQFAWCRDEEIGFIHGGWNVLLTDGRLEHPEPAAAPKLLHMTQGGPWHGEATLTGMGEAWLGELRALLDGGNPRGLVTSNVAPDVALLTVLYRKGGDSREGQEGQGRRQEEILTAEGRAPEDGALPIG